MQKKGLCISHKQVFYQQLLTITTTNLYMKKDLYEVGSIGFLKIHKCSHVILARIGSV